MPNTNEILFEPEKREKKKKKNGGAIPLIAAILIFALVAALMIFLLYQKTGETPGPKETIVKNENSISVPGYEALTFKADSLEQTVELKNPEQNTCYFQTSLILADGTLLWRSELFEPGETSGKIRLQKALPAGNYKETVLHYDCFRMDESLTPLNGAEMKLTLYVK